MAGLPQTSEGLLPASLNRNKRSQVIYVGSNTGTVILKHVTQAYLNDSTTDLEMEITKHLLPQKT